MPNGKPNILFIMGDGSGSSDPDRCHRETVAIGQVLDAAAGGPGR